jgi:hypothetical protein
MTTGSVTHGATIQFQSAKKVRISSTIAPDLPTTETAHGPKRRVTSHRLLSVATIVACWFFAIPASAAALDAAPPSDSPAMPATSIEWGVTYASKYLFYGGFDYSEGKPVFQPQATAGWNGLSLQIWSNCDQARREVNELDVTIQHDWQRGRVSGVVGIAHLQYPHRDWRPTQELIGTLALKAFLEPTLDLHWDVAEGQGGYWTAGLSRGWSIPRASFSVTSKLYGLEHYYRLSGMTALETGVTVTSEWAGLSFESSLQRQWTRANRDLVGESRISPGWLLALTVASP